LIEVLLATFEANRLLVMFINGSASATWTLPTEVAKSF
jgi:hypothetical protein